MIGSRNLEYPWIFTDLRSDLAKVSEEEIVAINEAVFFYPFDLEYTNRVSVYIHHYSPPLQGIVVKLTIILRSGGV